MSEKTEVKKTWREKRKRRELSVSASQHETFLLCRRKWWLSRVRGLKEPTTASQVFGTVLHAVCERFLKADDLGRDLTPGENFGKPVNLYPEGWEIADSRFGQECPDCDGKGGDCKTCYGKGKTCDGKVTPEEADLIKRLVSAAIEEGVLERRPGRKIEGDFNRLVDRLPCPHCFGLGTFDTGMDPDTVKDRPQDVIKCEKCGGDGKGTTIMLRGFIDVAYRDEVEDHKSMKTTKYAKSPKGLTKNTQMLLYAGELAIRAAERGETVPTEFKLRHNCFSKDGKIRKTESPPVPFKDVEEHWHRFTEDCYEMARLRDTVERFHEIEPPADMSRACNAYNGCPFRTICHGQETEEGYEKRLDRFSNPVNVQKESAALAASVEKENAAIIARLQERMNPMTDFASRIAQRRGIVAAAGVTAPAMNPPAMAAQVITPIVQMQQPAAAPVMGTAAVIPVQAAPAPVAAQAVATVIAEKTSNVFVLPEGMETPPWHDPNCKACVNSPGFNSKGMPCRMCDFAAPKANPPRPMSSAFNLQATGGGSVIWQNKENEQWVGESPILAATPAPVVAQVRQEALAPAPAPAVVAQPAQAPVAAPVVQPTPAPAAAAPAVVNTPAAPEAAPVAEVESETTKKEKIARKEGAGRPKKGFILVVNAVVAKGEERYGSGRGVYRLEEILKTAGEKLVEQSKAAGNRVDSYFDLDAFQRRDAIAALAPQIVEEFGADMVVCNGIGVGQSDLRSLFDAIRPYASMEIVASAMI